MGLRQIAAACARRDHELGLSPATCERIDPGRWQQLHELAHRFDTESRVLIDVVVESVNAELILHGFRLQPTRTLRLLCRPTLARSQGSPRTRIGGTP
jgi:hypothetical protein